MKHWKESGGSAATVAAELGGASIDAAMGCFGGMRERRDGFSSAITGAKEGYRGRQK